MKLSVIIPLYNEKNTIIEILNRIEAQDFIKKQLIVVNDCSSDSSSNLLNEYVFKSEHIKISHTKNLGKGACIKSAKKYINGDIVIIQDADLEYNPADYKNLIAPIANNKSKIVYGSRILGKRIYKRDFTSQFRVFGNWLLTKISNIINNQKLTDAHTCYKVFSAEVFEKIDLKENDFSFCPEITTKVSNLGYEVTEVPIAYKGRTYAEGKKISIFDALKALCVLIKYKLF